MANLNTSIAFNPLASLLPDQSLFTPEFERRRSSRIKKPAPLSQKDMNAKIARVAKTRSRTAAILPSPGKEPALVTPTTQRVKQFTQENDTPDKLYNLSFDEDEDKVVLPLTPSVKKLERVIYMFRNKTTGEVLIGKTETEVTKRVSGYVSAFNNPKSAKGKLPLPNDVRKNPDNFEFGVLGQVPDDLDIDKLESHYIELKKEIGGCYNQRKGGGGGHARKALKTKASIKKTKKVTQEIFTNFISPQKNPVVKSKKGPQVLLSPESKKTAKVIYVFKNNVTGQRYIGKTMRELRKRISEHMHFARHTDKENSQKELYKDLRKNPADFSVGILYKAPKKSKDIDLDTIEKAFITHYDSVNTGYNQNGGGGGG